MIQTKAFDNKDVPAILNASRGKCYAPDVARALQALQFPKGAMDDIVHAACSKYACGLAAPCGEADNVDMQDATYLQMILTTFTVTTVSPHVVYAIFDSGIAALFAALCTAGVDTAVECATLRRQLMDACVTNNVATINTIFEAPAPTKRHHSEANLEKDFGPDYDDRLLHVAPEEEAEVARGTTLKLRRKHVILRKCELLVTACVHGASDVLQGLLEVLDRDCSPSVTTDGK